MHNIEIIKKSDIRYGREKGNVTFAKAISGFISKGVFRVVVKEYVEHGANILGSCFILRIKNCSVTKIRKIILLDSVIYIKLKLELFQEFFNY